MLKSMESTRRKTILPFIALHLGCLAAFFMPVTPGLIGLAVSLYFVRMFGITAGYHRYFSHKSFKTSRGFQFFLALLGSLAFQKGVLWWAAHHRTHHRFSGTPEDIHAPETKGFWWSHVGWIIDSESEPTNWKNIRDFQKYPELLWLNKHYLVPGLVLGLVLLAGWGFGAFVWGFLISTVACLHSTFFINSLCHMIGKRRFDTVDDSRNSAIMALLTMGEGWHNNHHYYQHSTRQGFYWYEIDLTYYILKLCEALGLVWNLKAPPQKVYDAAKQSHSESKHKSKTDFSKTAANASYLVTGATARGSLSSAKYAPNHTDS